jgi:hypothetical protein
MGQIGGQAWSKCGVGQIEQGGPVSHVAAGTSLWGAERETRSCLETMTQIRRRNDGRKAKRSRDAARRAGFEGQRRRHPFLCLSVLLNGCQTLPLLSLAHTRPLLLAPLLRGILPILNCSLESTVPLLCITPARQWTRHTAFSSLSLRASLLYLPPSIAPSILLSLPACLFLPSVPPPSVPLSPLRFL